MQEAYEDTDATRQINDFLGKLPVIERMNEIRNELQNAHREVINQRFEKGDLQVGMPMTQQGYGSQEGYGSHEGDDPGASGSGEQRVTIKAFKVIKVEFEEDETTEAPKITIAVLIAVILTLITQMLFTKCKKRYVVEETRTTRVEEVIEEESEDDFEIILNNEEEQEEAEEQGPQQEEEEEQQPEEVEAEIENDEQVQPPPEVVQEGRKIYITKTGIKYHLNQRCDKLKGYRSYERKSCERCVERTRDILDINPNQSPPQEETELTFAADEYYHHKDCEVIRHNRRRGTKPICFPCESEERMFLWNPEARERGPATIIRR
jgi:hypothetical protein